jgi:hypothetical protein
MILKEGVAKAMNRFNQRPGRKENTEVESGQRQSPTSGSGDSSNS